MEYFSSGFFSRRDFYILTFIKLVVVTMHLAPRGSSTVAAASRASTRLGATSIKLSDWTARAEMHASELNKLVYPSGDSLKSRMHLVSQDPIYNFLHSYYRYSVKDLKKFSPGIDVLLEDADLVKHNSFLIERLMTATSEGAYYDPRLMKAPADGRYGWINVTKIRDILSATGLKQPFFGCFGLHEWAMLYSGSNLSEPTLLPRHQEQLSLRIPQSVIDDVVRGSGQLKCTHFDAWRFFHPDAQGLNIVSPLSRERQVQFEQPGCIHATMDLFKYAYQLYPFVSSELLLQSLKLAIKARKIDMRASPYDVSHVEGCEEPLCVETSEGRRLYVAAQEDLFELSSPIRTSLLQVYEDVLWRYSHS